MKYLIPLMLLMAVSTFTLSSCKKDPCKNTVCQNSGTCVEGTCECSFPFTGENCEVRMTKAFVGTYTGTMNCASQPSTETITVTESQQQSDRILFSYGTTTFYGQLTDTLTFVIPSQTVQQGPVQATLVGDGELSGVDLTQLTMAFTITASGLPIACTFSGIRQ